MSDPNQRPKKIAVIGAGAIGQQLRDLLLKTASADDITLWNRSEIKEKPEPTRGSNLKVAKDISDDQAEIIAERPMKTDGSVFPRQTPEGAVPSQKRELVGPENLPAAMDGADIIVITAGIPRTDPNQTRLELLARNAELMKSVAEAASKNPNAVFIVTTNPNGELTKIFQEMSGISPERIIGLGAELDSARFAQSIYLQYHLPHDCVRGEAVIGDHSPSMVPLTSQTMIYPSQNDKRVQGVPPKSLDAVAANDPRIGEIVTATKEGGSRITNWRGVSDYKGPATAIKRMIDHIVHAGWKGEHDLLPIYCTAASPDFGGIYIGRPVKFKGGLFVNQHLPEMSAAENTAWLKSVAGCQKSQAGLHELMQAAPLRQVER